MKITKEMGMACLDALALIESGESSGMHIPFVGERDLAFRAVWSLANDNDAAPDDRRRFHPLALAMCAAIAGVKPE